MTCHGGAPPTAASARSTRLILVCTNTADCTDLSRWVAGQLDPGTTSVPTCWGYLAGAGAVARGDAIVVVDVGADPGRESWRLAELRSRASDATVVVVADATLLPSMAGALRADVAVRSVEALPPLRELLLTPAAAALPDPQTSRRRSTR